MSTPTHDDVLTEVVNDLIKDLSRLPHSLKTIFHLVTNNLNSTILPEIQQLSLSKLDFNQTSTLLPVLAHLTGLTSLSLPECQFSPDHFKFLFMDCPALSSLKSLELRDVKQLRSEDLLLLSQSTTLTNLTSLDLHACNATVPRVVAAPQKRKGGAKGDGFAGFGSFGADGPNSAASGLVALLSSPVVQNLTHLNLGSAFTDPLVHTTIATSPHLSNLVSLDLSRTEMAPGAVAALAASTTLNKVTHLNLASNDLGDKLIAKLFPLRSLLPKKLQSLDLAYTRITTASLKVLLKVSPDLRELNLKWNDSLGPTGAAFIATSLSNLTKLDLANCNILDEGYAALAASTTLTNLRELNLYNNQAQAKSIVALVDSPTMANLTHLDLSSTHKDPEVLITIAKSPAMSKLQHLSLSNAGAGDKGITALVQSTTLSNLTSLNLCDNDIGPKGTKALCTSPVVSKLTFLGLDFNKELGKSIAAVLAAPKSTLHSLIDLSLSNVELSDKNVMQLLATSNLDQLNVLNLRFNRIYAESIRAKYRARFDHPL